MKQKAYKITYLLNNEYKSRIILGYDESDAMREFNTMPLGVIFVRLELYNTIKDNPEKYQYYVSTDYLDNNTFDKHISNISSDRKVEADLYLYRYNKFKEMLNKAAPHLNHEEILFVMKQYNILRKFIHWDCYEDLLATLEFECLKNNHK